MPVRQVPLVTGEYYHIYNRGVDRGAVFRNTTDYHHFLLGLDFYRYIHCPVRFSLYCAASPEKQRVVREVQSASGVHVSVYAFALMPNHFHLLVRQEQDNGIHAFLFKAINSYARYFNTKRKRVGPVFQGNFQVVRIESDEQLLHVSRYIHLNPVVAGMMILATLDAYPYTSYPQYIGKSHGWMDAEQILSMIGSAEKYAAFVHDQEQYIRELATISRVAMDNISESI